MVRQRDLRRVVFDGEDASETWRAVAASCAIPGFFQPIVIGGEAYVDGGVRSPTNADVLRSDALDLVIVVSPMSGRDLGRVGSRALMRRHAGARLEHEIRTLRRAGIPTVVVEPGADVMRLAGLNVMSNANVAEIVRAAYFDTAELLEDSRVAASLAPLSARAERRHQRATGGRDEASA